MPSVISRYRSLLIIAAFLLSGCRPKLPDPQVIRYSRTETPVPTALPTAAPEPTPFLIPSPTVPEPEPESASILYDVPVISQKGLLLNSAPTGVGCVPACIEMITAWWHSVSDTYPILTAQETIDRNADEGLYAAGRGMTSASAADELAELGYVHSMTLNGSKEELLSALETHGPAGVLVKTNWVPTTMNHAAVLTAYDPAADLLTFNDPFYGSSVQWSWEAFDGIWGLNYAGDKDYSGAVVRRVFFSIYPEPAAAPEEPAETASLP